MGQQQSLPENARRLENCLTSPSVDTSSRFFVESQSAITRNDNRKSNSSKYSSQGKNFNSLNFKPPPDLNKDLPKLHSTKQKRPNIFRSRARNFKSQESVEETDNFRTITHLFSNSDLSCQSGPEQRTTQPNTNAFTSSPIEQRKSLFWPKKAPNISQSQNTVQNGPQTFSIEQKLGENTSVESDLDATGINTKKGSQTKSSIDIYRNSFLSLNITSKLLPNNKTETRKSALSSHKLIGLNTFGNNVVEDNMLGHWPKIQHDHYTKVDTFQPQRTVTPNELEYRHIGAYKLGSLRITNGTVSPAQSPERGLRRDMRPKSNERPTLHDSNVPGKTIPTSGITVRPWTVSFESPLRNHLEQDLTPTNLLLRTSNYDVKDPNTNNHNTTQEDISPCKLESESVQTSDDPFHQGMISPYSLVELDEPSPIPQTTKVKLAVRDSLFDEEPWTPTILHQSLYSSETQTPQILGEDDRSMILNKPLAKADSGYRSNVSLQLLKNETAQTPEQNDSPVSCSNSGAFSFSSSGSLKEIKPNHSFDQDVNLSTHPPPLNSQICHENSRHVGYGNKNLEKDALPLENNRPTIKEKIFISPTTSSSTAESTFALHSSTDSTYALNDFSPDSYFSKSSQLLPSPLFSRTSKNLSASVKQNYQDIPFEELEGDEKQTENISLDLTSKLLLHVTNSKFFRKVDTIEADQSLIEQKDCKPDVFVKNGLTTFLDPVNTPVRAIQDNLPPKISGIKSTYGSNFAINQDSKSHKDPQDVEKSTFSESESKKVPQFGIPESEKTFDSLSESKLRKDSEKKMSTSQSNDSPYQLDSTDVSNTIPESKSKHLPTPGILSTKSSRQQNSYAQSQSLSSNRENSAPPIPKRNDYIYLQKNSLRFPDKQLSHSPETTRSELPIVSERMDLSTDGEYFLSRNKVNQIKNASIHDSDFISGKSKRDLIYQTTLPHDDSNQPNPKPSVVPTLVAAFQAIEKKKDQDVGPFTNNKKFENTESTIKKMSSLKKNASFGKTKNSSFSKLLQESQTSNIEKNLELVDMRRNLGAKGFRQDHFSRPSSSRSSASFISAKEKFENRKPGKSKENLEPSKPKRYHKYSQGSSASVPDVLKSTTSFQTHHNYLTQNSSKSIELTDISRFSALKQGISRFITQRPSSASSGNESNLSANSVKEKCKESNRQQWRYRSSSSFSRAVSSESSVRSHPQNLGRQVSSNMNSNIKSKTKEELRHPTHHVAQDNSAGKVTRNKTSSPRRKPRSHPPQAHVTRRSYSILTQTPPVPDIQEFYTYIENTQKQVLQMQNLRGTNQESTSSYQKKPNDTRKDFHLDSQIKDKISDHNQDNIHSNFVNSGSNNEENPPNMRSTSPSSPFEQQTLLGLILPSENHSQNSSFIDSKGSNNTECPNGVKVYEKEKQSHEEAEIQHVEKKSLNDKKNIEVVVEEQKKENRPEDSILNRGRPIPRAVETVLLSKRSEVYSALNLKLKFTSHQNINEKTTNSSHFKVSDNSTMPSPTSIQTNVKSNQNISQNSALESLEIKSKKQGLPRSWSSLPSNRLESNFQSSIDSLPSQNGILRSRLASLNPDMRPKKNIRFPSLDSSYSEILMNGRSLFGDSQQILSEISVPTPGKRRLTIDTLPTQEKFNRSSLLISPKTLSHEIAKNQRSTSVDSFQQICLEENSSKQTCSENVFPTDKQETTRVNISSLDSLPSQRKDSKKWISKPTERRSSSPSEIATSPHLQSPYASDPQIEPSESRKLNRVADKRRNSLETGYNGLNQRQNNTNVPVYGSNPSNSKNFPTIPKSILSYHQPSLISPPYSSSASTEIGTEDKSNMRDSILSLYSYRSPVSSAGSQEDKDILVLNAGWRKSAVFQSYNNNFFSQPDVCPNINNNLISDWTQKPQGTNI